ELAHALEEVHLADGVGPQGLRRRVPGGLHEALRRQVNDVVRPRLLEERAHREEIAQVALDQVDPLAQVLDVLGLAPPAQRADHVGPALERELAEMAAHETGDSNDQNAQEPYRTPLPKRPITRRDARRG